MARAAWGRVQGNGSHPGTPATEILEYASRLPEMYSEWSVNEKVSGGLYRCIAGRQPRSLRHEACRIERCLGCIDDPDLIGVGGGLVIAVADDVGLSSSQNEQDSRFWGRFAHVPVLEPSDAQEAYDLTRFAFDLSGAV